MWDGALSSPVKISMAEEMPGSSPVSKISRLLSARMVLSALFLSNTVSHIVLTPLESATQRSVVEWEVGGWMGWGRCGPLPTLGGFESSSSNLEDGFVPEDE